MKKLFFFLICWNYFGFFAQNTISIPLWQGNGADSYLASGAPSNNYGNHPDLGGNTWTCNGTLCLSRALFRFDLSAVPANMIVTSATLSLYADTDWGPYPTMGPMNEGLLKRITAAWSENSVTWNSQPPVTAVNQVTLAPSASSVQNYSVNVTQLVQDMISQGNNGFMLQMSDEVNYYKSLMFASSDHSNTAFCPVLTVTYEKITGVAVQNALKERLRIFPQPSANSFRLVSGENVSQIKVLDVTGNELEQMRGEQTKVGFGEGLSAGVYYVCILMNDGATVTSKIIKTGE